MQLQVTGQLIGLEARSGGWFAASIQEQNQQYPKKLSTKRPDLVAQVQQMMGQMVTALYNESESTNINPHSGTPYINRFLEALGMAGSMPAPQQQPQQQAPQPAYQTQTQPAQGPYPYPVPVGQPIATPQPVLDMREVKIHRQTATKVAVQILPLLSAENHNLAALIRISEQLVQYYDNGVQWTTPPVEPQQPQAQQGGGSEYNPGYAAQPGAIQAQPQGYENPAEYPTPTDDIPF